MNMTDFRISGLACPPITPYTEDGEVNVGMIKTLVEFISDQGITCLFVNGSTGEAANLTQDERKLTAQTWVSEAKGKIDQVMIQVGCENLKYSIDLAKHAEEIGADAIACVAPTYFSDVKRVDYVEYMRQVAASAPHLPFYLYDIQFVTGIKVSAAQFFEAAVPLIPTLCGLKHTTPDFVSMNQIITRYSGKYNLIMGTDETFIEGLGIGADTTICNCYMGHVFNRLREAFKTGDLKTARIEQARALKITDMRRKYGLGAVDGTKAILIALGVNVGQARLPLSKVSSDIIENIKLDLKDMGFEQWAMCRNVKN